MTKYEVRLNQLKLYLGLFGAKVAAATHKAIAIQITAKASSKSNNVLRLPFYPTTKRQLTHTTDPRNLSKSQFLIWDAPDLCDFHVVLNNPGYVAHPNMVFQVLYGETSAQPKDKLAVVGEVMMKATVAELLAREEKMKTKESNSQLQRNLPIELKVNGLCIQATLSVSMSFLRLRNSHSSPRTAQNSVESRKQIGLIGRLKYLARLMKNKKGKTDGVQQEQASPYQSDGSLAVFDSDDSSNKSTSSSLSSINNAGTETPPLGTDQRSWSTFSLNREGTRELSFITTKSKSQTLTNNSGLVRDEDKVTTSSLTIRLVNFFQASKETPKLDLDKDNHSASNWKVKELTSRDRKAKLKTNVFLASFDQRSQQASGESACTALVAFIAHWLHSNREMPTRPQFDGIITEGSSEWRKLCNNDNYMKRFSDKHFDLETIIEAKIRPIRVVPEKSYTGFFSPEKFESLKGHMSFDDIWSEINKVVDCEPRIYIVSWNDHFFVLKVESEAYYIIDTLGERLFEGCQQAFILKFDKSSLMLAKRDKYNKNTTLTEEYDRLEVICSGKECCKEFIKHFLAAIPLLQLEGIDGSNSYPYLHRLLQIDFHYTSSDVWKL